MFWEIISGHESGIRATEQSVSEENSARKRSRSEREVELSRLGSNGTEEGQEMEQTAALRSGVGQESDDRENWSKKMNMYKIGRRSKLETDGSDQNLEERSIRMPEDGGNRSQEPGKKMTGGRRHSSPEPENGEN